jgi:hypothetical protein
MQEFRLLSLDYNTSRLAGSTPMVDRQRVASGPTLQQCPSNIMEASMAIDVYLQIDGIRGESADSERRYTQQLIAGGAGGNTAGGWDLASNRVA